MCLKEVSRSDKGTVYFFFEPESRKEIAIKLFSPAALERFFTCEREIAELIPSDVPIGVFRELSNLELKRLKCYWPDPSYKGSFPRVEDDTTLPKIEMLPMLRAKYIPKDLFDVMDDVESQMPLLDIRRIARQVATAIAWLHSCKIVHSDIKAENIRIDESGLPVVSDFDLAVKVESSKQRIQGFRGSPGNMPPEMFITLSYDARGDWWSFGTFVWEMYTGRTFMSDLNEISDLDAIADQYFIQFMRMFDKEYTEQEYLARLNQLIRQYHVPFFSWQNDLRDVGYNERKDPPEVVERMISFLSQFLTVEDKRAGWEGIVQHEFTRQSIPRRIGWKGYFESRTVKNK